MQPIKEYFRYIFLLLLIISNIKKFHWHGKKILTEVPDTRLCVTSDLWLGQRSDDDPSRCYAEFEQQYHYNEINEEINNLINIY